MEREPKRDRHRWRDENRDGSRAGDVEAKQGMGGKERRRERETGETPEQKRNHREAKTYR